MNAPSIAVTDRREPETLTRARQLARACITNVVTGSAALDDATIELARAEGLGPLLGARLAQRRVDACAEQKGALIREHQLCLAANVVRQHATARFVERCRRSGIPVAWLKGMALIQSVFHPGQRSMIDVDALVPSARWHEACDIALDLGGRPVDFPGRPYTLGHDYVRAFTGASGVTIEVHRFVCESSLFGIEYDGPDGLFARTTSSASGLAVLEDGDLFLTLAAHAAKHTFDLPLRSFFDGLVMLDSRRFDLVAVAERARRWKMARAFRMWMHTLHALAPWLVDPPADEPVRWPALAGAIWSRTGDAAAWQRFVRLAWIAEGPAQWTRHVLTRVGMRLGDLVQSHRSGG